MKYCLKCGKGMDGKDEYCPYCGAKAPDISKRVEEINKEVIKMEKAKQAKTRLVPKDENEDKKSLLSVVLARGAIIYGCIMAVLVFMFAYKVQIIYQQFERNLDLKGASGIIKTFPIFYWLALLVSVAFAALAIYRYTLDHNDKVNIVYAISFGINVVLIHKLSMLKELANQLGAEDVLGSISSGIQAYSQLSSYKTSFILLGIMSVITCFIGVYAVGEMQKRRFNNCY